jgi:hypothetical protein
MRLSIYVVLLAADPRLETIGETSFMISIRVLAAVSLLGIVAACGGPGSNAGVQTAEPVGETMKDIGDHVVHFSAFTTDQLPASIARTYNIVRSRNRAMLNVSVIAEENNMAAPATVEVKTVNLTGQVKNVTMRRIDEEEAIYYVGDTAVANRETLIFDISVTPEGVTAPSTFRFKREFFTDGGD